MQDTGEGSCCVPEAARVEQRLLLSPRKGSSTERFKLRPPKETHNEGGERGVGNVPQFEARVSQSRLSFSGQIGHDCTIA